MDTSILKSLDVNKYGVDEMVELSAGAGLIIAHYEELEVEVPDYLLSARKALLTAIDIKNRGKLEAKAKELTARIDALTPAGTKRQQLQGELAKLTKKLAAAK